MTPDDLPAFWGRPDMACADVDPEVFFPEKPTVKAVKAAKKVCRQCPFRVECATYARDRGIRHGIWGATTPQERGFGKGAAGRSAPRRGHVEPGVSPSKPVVDRVALFAAAERVAVGELSTAQACAALDAGATLMRAAVRVVRHAPHLVEAVVAGRVTLSAAEVTARLAA